jgi:outer membrane protein
VADLPSPLDLKGAVGYALDHNFSILQARETIRLQEGVIVQVRGQSIPNVSAQGQYQRTTLAISETYPPATSLWNVELKATQNLYAGGGVVSAIKSAQLTATPRPSTCRRRSTPRSSTCAPSSTT